MARIKHVLKSQKPQGNCGHCHQPIPVGTSYKWVKLRPSGPRSSLTLKRHESCPTWRPSELTFSKMRGVLQAQEEFSDFLGAWTPEDGVEAVSEALSAAAEAIREVAEEYRESAQNIIDGFNGNEVPMATELQEKGDELETWANEVEIAVESIEDPPEEVEEPEEPEEDADEAAWEEYKEAKETFDEYEADFETWGEEVVSAADGVINECPI